MIKEELQKYIGKEQLTVVEVMQKIDLNGKGILYIVNDNDELSGSLTDGDIRRWIIKTGDLSSKASQVMFTNTKFLFEKDFDMCHRFMDENKINSVPILNHERKMIDIFFRDVFNNKTLNTKDDLSDIPVIIMAGGQGTRLYPYTKILPKPLIPIGDTPIIERIINSFNQHGARDFYLTVNYKKEMIKLYFSELKPDYSIHYIEEEKPLGTAGSIKLIKDVFNGPVIITNCDILIEADYGKIIEYHEEAGNVLTMVSSLKNITIPYGVIHSKENGIINSIEEKPKLSYFINTGVYVLNPEYINEIPSDTFYHMTNLAEKLIKKGLQVGMYPISEKSFLDMGEFEEMKKMEERLNIRTE